MLEIVSSSIFYEIAALLIIAAALGFVGLLIRLPLIVSFLLVGVIAGPSILGLVEASEHIELLAELGVTILLFLVGLKLDIGLIRTIGLVALMTGLGQVAFTSILGFAICLGLGLSPLESLYISVALTFSSTIIIVKLLSDKREIDSLHGRIALGFLIVQDLVVILVMMVLSAFGVGTVQGGSTLDILLVLVQSLAMVGGVWLFIRYLAQPLMQRFAKSPELMVAFSIGWAAFLASLGDHFGFGKELGGLIAGVSLASTPYREAIGSRLAPLRDFMLLFFFIALGSRLELADIGDQAVAAIILSLFVLIGNPLIVMVIMGAMGYRKRTGFLAGLTVAQISEFSLIFAAMGLMLGHIDSGAVALVTLVGLVTIGLSTYMILYSHPLYRLLEPVLGNFERRVPHREQTDSATERNGEFDVILFGLGRYGSDIVRGLRQHGLNVLGIDFDPEVLRHWRAQGLAATYGDAGDPDFAEALPLSKAKWVISTVRQPTAGVTHQDSNATLIASVRAHGFQGRVALTAQDAREAVRLRRLGADLVLMPFVDAARQAVEAVVEADKATGEPVASRAAAEIILADGERSDSC